MGRKAENFPVRGIDEHCFTSGASSCYFLSKLIGRALICGYGQKVEIFPVRGIDEPCFTLNNHLLFQNCLYLLFNLQLLLVLFSFGVYLVAYVNNNPVYT